jgi:hypothetical protein
MDTIFQFVYSYPPPIMTVHDISGIGSDGTLGIISVNIDLNTILGSQFTFVVPIIHPNQTAQIYLTPEAFVNWYNNNIDAAGSNSELGQIAASLSEPINGFPNSNAETANFLAEQGFYWEPYNSNYANEYNVSSAAIDPVNNYGFTSNNLYMLIRSEAAENSFVSNNDITNMQLQTQNNLTQNAITNQIQNTKTFGQMLISSVEGAANTIGQGIQGIGSDIENGAVSFTKDVFNADIEFTLIGIAAITIIVALLTRPKK